MNFLDGRVVEKEENEVIAVFDENKIVFPKEKAKSIKVKDMLVKK